MNDNNSTQTLRQKLYRSLKLRLKQESVVDKQMSAFDKIVSRRELLSNSGKMALLGTLIYSGLVPSSWAKYTQDQTFNVGSLSDIGLTSEEILFEGGANAPVFNDPLIKEPQQQISQELSDRIKAGLGFFENLKGTWTNQTFTKQYTPNTYLDQSIATAGGGTQEPYSYDIMPLPQRNGIPSTYIVFSHRYYEELTFSSIAGFAANRTGNNVLQNNPLLYEQRVYFADGGNPNALVHVENGTLNNLTSEKQLAGFFGNEGPAFGSPSIINPLASCYKQVSVPHGNSIIIGGESHKSTKIFADILASGVLDGFKSLPFDKNGTPIIPDNNDDYFSRQYRELNGKTNTIPTYTSDPKQLFMDMRLDLSIDNDDSSGFYFFFSKKDINGEELDPEIKNLRFFESSNFKKPNTVNVVDYKCLYVLSHTKNFQTPNLLFYIQQIDLTLPDYPDIIFPHVTTNTLLKKSNQDEG